MRYCEQAEMYPEGDGYVASARCGNIATKLLVVAYFYWDDDNGYESDTSNMILMCEGCKSDFTPYFDEMAENGTSVKQPGNQVHLVLVGDADQNGHLTRINTIYPLPAMFSLPTIAEAYDLVGTNGVTDSGESIWA
jgi:hypothetical protein